MFQRTANWAAPLHNGKIDAETQARIKAGYGEIFARCKETFACFVHTPDPRGAFEVSDEEREAFYEKLYGERGFGIWQGNFKDILIDRAANATISDFVARKIRERVKNQAPSPGTEAALHRLIDGIASGNPDYNEMSPALAAATRKQMQARTDWGDMLDPPAPTTANQVTRDE